LGRGLDAEFSEEPELTQAKKEQQLRKDGQRGKAKRSRVTRPSLGENTNAAYIRARLERDGF
jgi:hypothetical protein